VIDIAVGVSIVEILGEAVDEDARARLFYLDRGI